MHGGAVVFDAPTMCLAILGAKMKNHPRANLPTLVQLLLERSVDAHRRAATERKQIHLQEWEEEPEFSVLGETELCNTEIAGVATSFIKAGQLGQQPEMTGDLLRKLKVLSNPNISTWTDQHTSSFPTFIDYICSLEPLRLTLLEIYLDQQETTK